MLEAQAVLFTLFGVSFTWVNVLAGIAGAIPASVALYKLYVVWDTREERRYQMLRRYLDNEEKNISGKRQDVLKSIATASRSYLTGREFDVGHEIDEAIVHLDSGRPELAEARLKEIERRLERNANLLRKRAEDLEKHRASVHIFLAALADKGNDTTAGLMHIQKAMDYNGSDLDAIKYQGILLTKRGDHRLAKRWFSKLRLNSVGAENAGYKAEAYLGLATVERSGGVKYFEGVEGHLRNAMNNLEKVPALEQDAFLRAMILRMEGEIREQSGWQGHDIGAAIQAYEAALVELRKVPLKRLELESEIESIEGSLVRLRSELEPDTDKSMLLLETADGYTQ